MAYDCPCSSKDAIPMTVLIVLYLVVVVVLVARIGTTLKNVTKLWIVFQYISK